MIDQEYQEDLYAALGVEETAPSDEIRKAYLKLAKKLHPDRFPNDPEKRAEAQKEFSKVARAHDILNDARQREEYDCLRGLKKAREGTGDLPKPDPEAQGQATYDRDTWARKHFERANDCLKRKKFPDAETAIKEAMRLKPDNADFLSCLAEIQLQRGWKTLALTSVNQALKIDPKHYHAKDVELRLKAQTTTKASDGKANNASGKKSFMDQLKDMLNKK
ncbi:MAG: DnaJ domain-containing protein [Candidatus Obscuribacterales bacterium]|nr:DnaJ domain-containing protein [Candidatus Obscuribacterales bacterium]